MPNRKIIDIFIAKLRKKIAVATGGQHYIETVWGKGYVLKDLEIDETSRVVEVVQLFPRLDTEFQKEVLETLDALNETLQPTDPKPVAVKVRHLRIFLAHAREDKERVRQLYATLKASGFDPWLDEVDMLPNQNWKVKIQGAIRDAGVLLACLSCNSAAK
jgi:hypothetical protein